MAFYSRAHYRRVSPPRDTPAEIAARLLDNRIREQARQEREARYPVITIENFDEACAWFESRVEELRKAAQ